MNVYAAQLNTSNVSGANPLTAIYPAAGPSRLVGRCWGSLSILGTTAKGALYIDMSAIGGATWANVRVFDTTAMHSDGINSLVGYFDFVHPPIPLQWGVYLTTAAVTSQINLVLFGEGS